MTKEDYKEKVEEHRQEVELDEESITKRSRVSRHTKGKKNKQKNPMMKFLVFVFILIPLCILCYVWFVFEPEVPGETVNKTDDKGIVVEIQDKNTAAAPTPEKEPAEAQPVATASEDQLAKETAAAEEARKIEEARKAEEGQKAAAQKLEEQKQQAAAQAKAAQEQKKAQEAQKNQAQGKSHNVQSTDNLYRIALKYYGNGSAEYVNKIKQANGLASDSISTGQVLMIP